MKILIVSSEAVPFAKTGGLADVSSALCIELNRLGHDARLLIPEYTPQIDRVKYEMTQVLAELPVFLDGNKHVCNIDRARFPGTTVDKAYFVQYGGFYQRPGIYSEAGIDYWDNPQRFAFLCKTALELCMAWDWQPDVIHSNDWQSALIPLYLKTHKEYKDNPFFAGTKTLMSVHNLAYQGRFSTWYNNEVEVDEYSFHPGGAEFYGDLNLLKGGLMYADKISTVSATYAEEIQTPNYGCALDGVLRARANDLSGILNGIDQTVWDTANDPILPAHFSAKDFKGKAVCKKALQTELGLDTTGGDDVPLIGIVSRLDYQKGLELILTQFDGIMHYNVQFAILGTGDKDLTNWLGEMAEKYPGKVSVNLRFDEELAHKIVAASDMFLMPSRFEPCGLTQMYSMRCGTIPVVRATGGLKDSVIDATPQTLDTATGFAFEWFDGWTMAQCLTRAIDTYRHDKKAWEKIMRNAMKTDFSWTNAAQQYIALYKEMI